MKESSGSSARCRKSFGKHFDNGIELRASKIAIGVGRTKLLVEIVFLPDLSRGCSDDLLREMPGVEAQRADVIAAGVAIHVIEE